MHEEPAQGFGNLGDTKNLWKKQKFYTLNSDNEQLSGNPIQDEHKKSSSKFSETFAGTKFNSSLLRKTQKSTAGGPLGTTMATDAKNHRECRNVSQFDDLVAPGDSERQSDRSE